MKKISSVLFAALLVVGMAGTAVAQDAVAPTQDAAVVKAPAEAVAPAEAAAPTDAKCSCGMDAKDCNCAKEGKDCGCGKKAAE